MRISILSLFPEFFTSALETSMLGRAIKNGIVDVELINIRDFAEGKHKVVDDKPFGGDPGMLMKPEPVLRAIESVRKKDSYVVYLTPQGNQFNSEKCEDFARKCDHLILICGHYEGIDQRVIDIAVDEEISIGDYILTSGMIPALVVLDGTIRFLDGAIGNKKSVYSDTFYKENQLKGPQYTRPANFRGLSVPEVLLSGHHQKKAVWREEVGKEKTKEIQIKNTRITRCIH